MLLTDTVALVTGGGRAIGRAIAIRLAMEGADIVLAARSVEAMESVAAEVKSLGRQALVTRVDLANPESVESGAQDALEMFGRVDVLVNNSGVGGPSKPLPEIELAEWEETFQVNVTGGYLTCHALLPSMISARRGSIVFVGSMTGKRPLVNRTPYAASKTALVGLVRTLAAEVGPAGVRVNLVSPGAVEGERLTWMFEQQAVARSVSVTQVHDEFLSASPLRRLVTADDVAQVVAFLASPRAAAITGEDINVSAGAVMY